MNLVILYPKYIWINIDYCSRAKISVRDFEPLKIIGRGAFGEVRVCRNRNSGEIVAIKKMKKTEMIVKN